jgi:hypothetical protein
MQKDPVRPACLSRIVASVLKKNTFLYPIKKINILSARLARLLKESEERHSDFNYARRATGKKKALARYR